MKSASLPFLFLIILYSSYLECAAEKKRSSKRHKAEIPSNPSLESIQETPGLQPRTVPKIKETSLPSATAGEGDNPSLNNPNSSDDESQTTSSQISGQSTASSSQSQSSLDSAISNNAPSSSAGLTSEQFNYADEVPHSQSSDATKVNSLQSSESGAVNNGQNTEASNTANTQSSDTSGAPSSQNSEVTSPLTSQSTETNGVYGNQAYELFSRTAQYLDTTTASRRDYTAPSVANEASAINNWQPADVNTSTVYKNSDLSKTGNSQGAGSLAIGSAFSPVQYVISTTNNNNNTAMNTSIGQPAPELIVPVAVAQQTEKKEGSEATEVGLVPRNQNQTTSNVTGSIGNASLPLTPSNSSRAFKSDPSPLNHNITLKADNKIQSVNKASKKSKLNHKRTKPRHHHHHKHRKPVKKSKGKRPHSEKVPVTGVDKTTPKFDWTQYENMTKLIAKMKGGGSEYPPFNLGSLLSLIPNEAGIRKEDIPSVLQSFVNQDGTLVTQDDIAKLDRESIEAEKEPQTARILKGESASETQAQSKESAQDYTPKPSSHRMAHPIEGNAQKSSAHGQISPQKPEAPALSTQKDTSHKIEDSDKDIASEQSFQKTKEKDLNAPSDNPPEKTLEKSASNLPSATTTDIPVKSISTPPSEVQQAIPPEPPLSLFTGVAPPTAKATIAETIAADTGQQLVEEVSKTAGISLPDNIPKECGGLVKAYTNGEMTMKEYLQKMRRCKFINNPNKDRYQQALLKKEAVTKLMHSDAEINQQAYKYALERMKDYVPSKKDTAQANAILEKWRSSTFGNSIKSKTMVPDAIKSFMSVQNKKQVAAAVAAAESAGVSKSAINHKTKSAKVEENLEAAKNAILAQITGQTGEMLTKQTKKEKEEKSEVSSELIGKNNGLEANTNLELLSSKKTDVPQKILSLSKIDSLQNLIEQRASIRSSIPKAPGKPEASLKATKTLPELTFKDAISVASVKKSIRLPNKAPLASKTVAGSKTSAKKTVVGKSVLPADKKDILDILDQNEETPEKNNKVPITVEAASLIKKTPVSQPLSGIVNDNLIRALQSMGPGQGFGLLGNKGMTLIATASKRSSEKEREFGIVHQLKSKHQRRSLLKKMRRDMTESKNSDNASERSRMDMPPNIQPGPKLMDKIRDMSSVIATP